MALDGPRPPAPFAAGGVITADYLPWARVTAASFAAHHPGVRFAVLVVDEPAPGQLRDDEPFELLRPADVGIGQTELDRLWLIYDGLELCCAAKPVLLRHLLQRAEAALYLDSDLCVYGSLADVARRAADTGVVLSPHSLVPRNADPSLPGDDALLQVGQFCAGFVAVGRRGERFLDWWWSKLARDCPQWDPSVPLRFLDQRWLDLVVNYFPCEVDRDPGAGVARWNLWQRALELDGDGYTVDGGPLRFFHFSSFDPADPTVLSPLAPPHPSTDLERSPALARLAGDYAAALIEAGWKPRAGKREPRRLAGIGLTAPVRAAIRAALIASERAAVAPVQGPADADAIIAWLRAPAGAGALSWYLTGLWAAHAGVRGVFPRVPGADETAYLRWVATEGVGRELVPPALAGPATAIRLDGARPYVALIDAREALSDPSLLTGLAATFSAADPITLLLWAPGANPERLLGSMAPLLAEHGLDGDDSPDLLAVVDAAGPGAIEPLAHAALTRGPATAFPSLPHAADAAALRGSMELALGSGRLAA
jgi:hypothetical protein